MFFYIYNSKKIKCIIYLKLGADATLSAKQAILVTPYDSRKNILTSTATLFKFPIKRTIYGSKWKNVSMPLIRFEVGGDP